MWTGLMGTGFWGTGLAGWSRVTHLVLTLGARVSCLGLPGHQAEPADFALSWHHGLSKIE
jgi:hypothetical protein